MLSLCSCDQSNERLYKRLIVVKLRPSFPLNFSFTEHAHMIYADPDACATLAAKLVGSTVRIFWPSECNFYRARVLAAQKAIIDVEYEDGDDRHTKLDLNITKLMHDTLCPGIWECHNYNLYTERPYAQLPNRVDTLVWVTFNSKRWVAQLMHPDSGGPEVKRMRRSPKQALVRFFGDDRPYWANASTIQTFDVDTAHVELEACRMSCTTRLARIIQVLEN